MEYDPLYKMLVGFFSDKDLQFDDIVSYVMRCNIGSTSWEDYKTLLILHGCLDNNYTSLEKFKSNKTKLGWEFNRKRKKLLETVYNHQNVHQSRLKEVFHLLEKSNCVRVSTIHKKRTCYISGASISPLNGTTMVMEMPFRTQEFTVSSQFRTIFKSWYLVRHIDEEFKLIFGWLIKKSKAKKKTYRNLWIMANDALVIRSYEEFKNAWMNLCYYAST
mgnify:CR=1 FL=1|jgi:hypothetical protein|tara:strand:+ start:154 stop:807 length:654 start_codon:yes stop_codon:yes gene_type:complete